MNILAGFKLNIKKPINEPDIEKHNKDTSLYPSNHVVLYVIIPSTKNTTTERLHASPSIPSVKFTALLLATSTNNMNDPYIKFILSFRFNV